MNLDYLKETCPSGWTLGKLAHALEDIPLKVRGRMSILVINSDSSSHPTFDDLRSSDFIILDGYLIKDRSHALSYNI